MKKQLLFVLLLLGIGYTSAQIKSTGEVLNQSIRKLSFQEKIALQKKNSSSNKHQTGKRSATNPSACGTDTSTFTDLSSTAYPLIAVSSNQSAGQYFGANQEITIKGFRFYAYVPWNATNQIASWDVYAKIYEAGLDSLPRGAAIDSVLMTIDTITGTLTFARMTRNAIFNKPITLSHDYILTVECAATTNPPSIVTNSWANADGEGRNLSMVQLNGRWFRGMNLNVGGIPFNAHFQMFPIVSYSFGTDFTISNNCYQLLDSFNFNNNYMKNVSGSIYYNEYMYYAGSGFDAECHDWTYDNNTMQPKRIHGKFRPGSKKNVDIKLRSFVVPYSVSLAFCYDSTEKTMYYNPNTPSFIGSPNGCVGENKSLDLNANADVTHRWFKKLNDTMAFNTGNQYIINNLSKNDTFYITGTNGTCTSRVYTALITANQTPTSLSVTNDSVCSDANAILKATPDVGDILWYRSATDETPVLVGNELLTGKLNADTTYYAEANNKGCLLASGRVAVTAFVNADFAPEKPKSITDTSVCYNNTSFDVVLSANTSSGNSSIRWFNVATGGNPIASTNTLTHTVTQRGTSTYYVEAWDGRCGSGRTPVQILAGAVPPTFAKITDEICLGDSANVAASSPWGEVHWYNSITDNTPFFKGKFLRKGGLTEAKSYTYFKTVDGICMNPNFDSVEVIVNIPPTATIVNAKDVCRGENAKIELQINQGIVKWYFDNSAQNSIATGTSLNVGEIFNNTTRYYETELNGCKSKRNAITVKVLDKPLAGFQYEIEFPRKLTCTPLNTDNANFQWNFGDGNTSSEKIGVNTYTNEGQYTVKMLATSTLSGCQDSSIVNITVNHNQQSQFHEITPSVYPNPVSVGSFIYSATPVLKAIWYDLGGRIMHVENKFDKFGELQVKVPHTLKNGIYLLELSGVNQNHLHKIQIH
jgi:hypothetical protein